MTPDTNRRVSSDLGKYQLFGVLGRGGMADVFLAVARGARGLNKLVVVKRLRSDFVADPAFLQMFLDEARLSVRLSHPNVVNTYEVGEYGDAYFIAMEYLEGQSLHSLLGTALKCGVTLPAGVSARIACDVLAGLHYAHELCDYDGSPLRIVHRDASPHNVIVTYDGVAEVVDFGIAKAAFSTAQTEVGILKGKVTYMAPEQLLGEPLDRRADIFVAGIDLWELLTHKRLMSGPAGQATLHRLINGIPIPRPSTVVAVDPRLDAVVARALEKDPDRRYQTALEMREALEAYIAASGVAARQEDVGRFVADMFASVRDKMRLLIQTNMAAAGSAKSTFELAAITVDSIRRSDSTPSDTGDERRSIRLLDSAPPPLAITPSARVPVPADESNTMPTGGEQPGKRRVLVPALMLALVSALAFTFSVARSVWLPRTRPAVSPAETPAPPPGSAARPSVAASVAGVSADTPETHRAPPPVGSSVGVGAGMSAGDSEAGSAKSAPAPPFHSIPTVPAVPPIASPRPASAPTAPAPKRMWPATTPSVAPKEDSAVGYLTLDTYPWTRVSEGGRVFGPTPLVRLPLSVGTHVLTLENGELGVRETYSVVIKPGETVSRRLAFQ